MNGQDRRQIDLAPKGRELSFGVPRRAAVPSTEREAASIRAWFTGSRPIQAESGRSSGVR